MGVWFTTPEATLINGMDGNVFRLGNVFVINQGRQLNKKKPFSNR
jgi:hypothetical protein